MYLTRIGSVLVVGLLMIGVTECFYKISRRTPSPAEPEPGLCADKMRRCKQWARDGDCTMNPTYMETNCKKSCNLCDPKIAGTTYTKEKMLKERLLNNYDAKVRPSVNTSGVLDVKLSFTVLHLIDVNEESQMFTLQGYIKMKWNDVRLAWTPSDFNEIMAVSFSSSQMWYPELNIANTGQADQTYILHDNPTPMMVRNNGDVIWTPRVEVTTLCSFDAKYFPVDSHECSIIFSPWLQLGAALNLTLWHLDRANQADVEDNVFQPNPKWRVKADLAEDSDFYHPCCDEPWPVVQVDLTITRNVPVITIMMVTSVVFVIVTLLLCFILPIRSIMRFVFSAGDCGISLLLLLHLSTIVPQSTTAGPIIVNVTAALLIESLAVLLYCGLLYHLSSLRHPQFDQALTLPPYFQNILNTVTKSRTRPTRRTKLQRDSGTISDDGNEDLVDMMFGSDEAHLIDYEVEPEGAHPKQQNGGTSLNQNGDVSTLTNGNDHTEHSDVNTDVGKGQSRNESRNSNFALVVLLNRLGLAVFAFAFAIELLIVMVI